MQSNQIAKGIVLEGKKDWVDLIIDQKSSGIKNEPPQFSDYPEPTLPVLRLFIKYFKIGSGGIPSKRSKSKFKDWVSGLQELEKVCPHHMEECMKIALEEYESSNNHFLIYRPQSIVNLLTGAFAKWSREHAYGDRIRKETEEKKNEKFVDPQTLKSRLGNLFEEE